MTSRFDDANKTGHDAAATVTGATESGDRIGPSAALGVDGVAIVAHRGASADYPENTVEAFKGAKAQGAHWVELDVRMTTDGDLLIHHDPVYGDGRSVHLTPAHDRPDSVPTLAEALDACAGMGVNIEIKNMPGDMGEAEGVVIPHSLEVVDIVMTLLDGRRGAGDDQAWLISSFDVPTIDRVRELSDSMPTGYLSGDLHADPNRSIVRPPLATARSTRGGRSSTTPSWNVADAWALW